MKLGMVMPVLQAGSTHRLQNLFLFGFPFIRDEYSNSCDDYDNDNQND
jgi:hypothetical protein